MNKINKIKKLINKYGQGGAEDLIYSKAVKHQVKTDYYNNLLRKIHGE